MLKFAIAVPVLSMLATMAHADTKTFPKPRAGVYRVDWCLNFGTQCGQPAADKFCQNNSYLSATDFDEAVDIGVTTPTIVQGTGQVCAAPSCDGFAQITCTRPDLPAPPMPPPAPGGGVGPSPGADTKLYKKPKVGGFRVNFCETKGIGCGQDAADAFCDAKGFDDAADFAQSPPAPPSATRYIGNGKLCKGPVCYAFTSILCENQP